MSVAIVTGGSRGIGREIALGLAKRGDMVAICFSGDETTAQKTVEECAMYKVKAMCVKADVSNPEDVKNLFEKVKATLGPVEILVNNAGITKDGLLIRMSEQDFDQVLDINLKGAFLCTKAAIPDMMKARKGTIINITSVVGLSGNPGQANYAASKAGLIGFTKTVAKEYGGKGIRCNAVAPGFISTKMTDALPEETRKGYLSQIPLKRFGTGEDVAKAVAFLASDEASYITGQVLSVDGGM